MFDVLEEVRGKIKWYVYVYIYIYIYRFDELVRVETPFQTKLTPAKMVKNKVLRTEIFIYKEEYIEKVSFS